MIDPPESDHVRPPQQERSRRTLEQIMEATKRLIEEEGIEGATVTRIVELSGTSVGSFYARFDGKADLIRHLEERVWRTAAERWREALSSRDWDSLQLEGVVRSVAALLDRIQREDSGARGALEKAGADGDEARRFHERLEHDVRDLLLRHRDRFGHPDPERAATVAYRWMVAGLRELRDAGAFSEGGGTAGLVPEVTRAVTAYLGGSADSDDGDGVEFFDVWQ